jgi:hypothetical protein
MYWKQFSTREIAGTKALLIPVQFINIPAKHDTAPVVADISGIVVNVLQLANILL